MSFWDLFSSSSTGTNKLGDATNLQQRLDRYLPDAEETLKIEVACIAGLFARVVYVDHHIHGHEKTAMNNALKAWTDLEQKVIDAITEISLDEIQTLAGLDDYKYANQLSDILDVNGRYHLLEALFHVAAADGSVANQESEEIRHIATALRLEHQHYIAARAKVKEHLGALKQ